jgi:NADPH:quinone reductase-like Zn-dependent oxidoreductase
MSNETTKIARIVRFHRLGGPEVLQVDEVPLPEPAPGEIRLRVKAIGLNRAEVMFRQGRYLVQPVLPSKLGYEASGIVEAVGPGVDAAWIGNTASTVPAFAPQSGMAPIGHPRRIDRLESRPKQEKR